MAPLAQGQASEDPGGGGQVGGAVQSKAHIARGMDLRGSGWIKEYMGGKGVASAPTGTSQQVGVWGGGQRALTGGRDGRQREEIGYHF